MFVRVALFLCFIQFSVFANRVFPTEKVIKLTLGVSKAAYLPIKGQTYIKNGGIVENPFTILPRFYLGFIPLPPKYDASKNKQACYLRNWQAKSYENKETEVLMFTDHKQKLAVFGFRGTEALNPIDWFSDFNMLPKRYSVAQTTFSVHRGFMNRYNFIANWFETEYTGIPQNYTIIITGHSLGGAEATLAAFHASTKLKRRPDAVITYGSPLVGDKKFQYYYDKMVGCNRTLRIAAKGDLFTHVPKLLCYIHVCHGTVVDGKTGLNVLKAHDLYQGYEDGIKTKFNANDINYGCDKPLV